jgi:fatty acid desaturase
MLRPVCGVGQKRHSSRAMARTIASITLSDPTFTPKAQRNAVERLALELINDERDLPFVWLSVAMTAVLVPLTALMYAGVFPWWLAPIYWAVLFGLFFDRYILMLHNTSHRRLFKRKYRLLNHYIPWVLGPFAGQAPETYFVHHITMHHAEGNLPNDLSSTMPYQRDSAWDFFRYFCRFFFLIHVDMTRYQLKKGRGPIVRRMLIGEFSFYALCIALSFVSWQTTLVVFVIPFLLCRFLMMAGNWGQHAFVDEEEPGNDYKSSVTCINARYNRRCWNDGYHIGHHVVANRHWTEMPEDFEKDRKNYEKNDAIVFEGLDNFTVWLWLMLKRYDVLASHFVELRKKPRSQEEIIALLKSRTKRFETATS